MTNEEVIKLVFQVAGQEAADRVRESFERLKGSVATTAETYEVLSTVVAKSVGGAGTYAIATDRLNVELDKEVRAAMEAAQAQRALGMALDESRGHISVATAALTDLRGQKSAGGMGFMGASYGIQDFITVISMGGGLDRALMSTTNNVTPMLMALGPGVAGAAGLAFTALVALGPVLDGLGVKFDSTFKEKVPEAADRLERLTATVKEHREAVEELTKKRELDYFEMTKYIEQTRALNNEEQALDDARKARSVGPGDTKGHRERGAAFREALGEYGGGERLTGALERAGVEEKRAERMIADALAGARGAAEEIQGRLRGRGPAEQIGYQSPEEKRRAIRQGGATDAILKRNAQRKRDEEKGRETQEDAMDAYLEQIGGEASRWMRKDAQARDKADKQAQRETKAAAKETPARRGARFSREIARDTGLELSPQMASRVGGRGEHPSEDAMTQARMAAQFQQATGGMVSGDEAMRAAVREFAQMRQVQDRLNGTMLEMANGFSSHAQAMEFHRQQFTRVMDQSPMPTGLPR